VRRRIGDDLRKAAIQTHSKSVATPSPSVAGPSNLKRQRSAESPYKQSKLKYSADEHKREITPSVQNEDDEIVVLGQHLPATSTLKGGKGKSKKHTFSGELSSRGEHLNVDKMPLNHLDNFRLRAKKIRCVATPIWLF
jgi:hypothetical protein